MPSWLWRAWLGPPAERGPRGLLGRRPRRRRLRPPPPPPGRPEPGPPPWPPPPGPDALCPPDLCPDPPPCPDDPCPDDPDPADPLPVPAFIVLSKPAGPGFSRCRRQTSKSLRFPIGCGRLKQRWRTATF